MEIYQKNSVDILEVKAEITIKNSDIFRTAMQKFLESPRSSFILDLEEVSYLNSSALGIIADTAIKLKKGNKELILAGIKPPIDEIFDIVKFHTFMELFQSLEDAMQYYSE